MDIAALIKQRSPLAQRALCSIEGSVNSSSPLPFHSSSMSFWTATRHARVGSVGDLLRKSAPSMGSMIGLIEAGVAPLLWTIGSQVANGDRPVYQEKLITQSICRSLSNLIESYRIVGELPVRALGATFPPSTDTVGSTMIHLAIVEAGVRAVDLGPSVPPEVIADAARDLHVEVVLDQPYACHRSTASDTDHESSISCCHTMCGW